MCPSRYIVYSKKPLVTAKIVKEGRILPATEFLNPAEYESWMRRGMPETGDVLFTTEAPLGEVAQVEDPGIALAQRVLLLRGRKELINNTYLSLVLKTPFVWQQILARSTGSTVRGIRQKELRRVRIPVPALERQQAIAAFDGCVSKLMTRYRVHLEQTEHLFNSLSQRAFRGEV